jgi:hypothetical protein
VRPLETAIEAVHRLDLPELARIKSIVAARIDGLTADEPLPASRLKLWWQRLTQPHRYARARDRENRALRAQLRRLEREVADHAR